MQIGDLLDARGLDVDVEEDEFVVSAVVIAAILVPDEATPRVLIGTTEGMGSIEQLGLIAAAKAICDAGWRRQAEED